MSNSNLMAQRRMFSTQIVDSDAFLEMPSSSQSLYFHLGMRSDDDGFIGNPNKILRMIGSGEDDLKVLIAKRFILRFDSGVVVIKHWLIHNLIRADLYKETSYKKEKSTLGLNENGAYTELRDGVTELKQIEAPIWLRKRKKELRTANVPQTVQNRHIGKDRLGKDSIDIILPTEPTNLVEESEPVSVLVKTVDPVNRELAQLLLTQIQANLPDFKVPRNLDNWADVVRKLRDIDHRTVDQIKYIINWCQKDTFWQANILSMEAVRRQWDKLVAQIKRSKTIQKPAFNIAE